MQVNFVHHQVDLLKTHHRKVTGHWSENKVPAVKTSLFRMITLVSNRSADCHRKEVPKGRLYMRPIQW